MTASYFFVFALPFDFAFDFDLVFALAGVRFLLGFSSSSSSSSSSSLSLSSLSLSSLLLSSFFDLDDDDDDLLEDFGKTGLPFFGIDHRPLSSLNGFGSSIAHSPPIP
jgi:hypothetical protein